MSTARFDDSALGSSCGGRLRLENVVRTLRDLGEFVGGVCSTPRGEEEEEERRGEEGQSRERENENENETR